MKLADLEVAEPNHVLHDANILCFDIETTPAHFEVDTYAQGKRWLGHKDITRPGGLLSWSAQWYHEPRRVTHMNATQPGMLQTLWGLLDASSYVVGWNSDSFDLRKVRGYFVRAGMMPPRPSKSIDLIKTARTLGFESAALAYVARILNVQHQKLDGSVLTDWRACLAGDPVALKLLRVYNNADVRCPMDVFDALRPWIPHHPYMGFAAADDNGSRCPRCGSNNTAEVGAYQAIVIRYRQHRCLDCTGLYRSAFHSRIGYTHAI